jgi:hypothetical protein
MGHVLVVTALVLSRRLMGGVMRRLNVVSLQGILLVLWLVWLMLERSLALGVDGRKACISFFLNHIVWRMLTDLLELLLATLSEVAFELVN